MYRIELTVEERNFLEVLLNVELEDKQANLDEAEGLTEEEDDFANDDISFVTDILIKTENAKEVANLNLRLLAELIEDKLSWQDDDNNEQSITGELREELKKINVLINGGE